MLRLLLYTIFFFPMYAVAQFPLYYKIHDVKGAIYSVDAVRIELEIKNRWHLDVKNCHDEQLESFLKILMTTKLSRRYLEHLITTSAKITIDISDKVGIMRKDGKYRLMAGLTGRSAGQSDSLIFDETSNLRGRRKRDPLLVFEENTISIYTGSITYCRENFKLDSSNTIIFDYDSNKPLEGFNLDSIQIEPIMNPDLLYANCFELYYFAGIHEIFHTTAKNIDVQLEEAGDPEYDAYNLERRAFRARSRINKKNRVVCH